MGRLTSRIFFALMLVCTLLYAYESGIDEYFTLEFVQSQRIRLQNFYDANPYIALSLFFVTYVLVAAFSIPGATVLTLLAGFLFDVLIGAVVVSFASSVGATLAFLTSRFLLRDLIMRSFSAQLANATQKLRQDGAYYLFALRLVPVFPFFVVNLIMGITPISVRTFYWVSQLGMFPATLIYTNAGARLGSVENFRDVMSPAVLGSLILLGVFPLMMRIVLRTVRQNTSD